MLPNKARFLALLTSLSLLAAPVHAADAPLATPTDMEQETEAPIASITLVPDDSSAEKQKNGVWLMDVDANEPELKLKWDCTGSAVRFRLRVLDLDCNVIVNEEAYGDHGSIKVPKEFINRQVIVLILAYDAQGSFLIGDQINVKPHNDSVKPPVEETPDDGEDETDPTPTPDDSEGETDPSPTPDDSEDETDPSPSPDDGEDETDPSPSPDDGEDETDPIPNPDDEETPEKPEDKPTRPGIPSRPGGFNWGSISWGGMNGGGSTGVVPGVGIGSGHEDGNGSMDPYNTVAIAPAEGAMTYLTMDGCELPVQTTDGAAFTASAKDATLTLITLDSTEGWLVDGYALTLLHRSGVDTLSLSLNGATVDLPTDFEPQGVIYTQLRVDGHTPSEFMWTITSDGVTADVDGRTYTLNDNRLQAKED